MDFEALEHAVELLEKCNADLEPDLMRASDCRRWLALCARADKLLGYGVAAVAARLDDAAELAKATGTSVGKARATVDTGKILASSDELSFAMERGEVSLDQAAEIARAEQASPGAAAELVEVARNESLHVLKDEARKVKLEAEQHRGLAERQHETRSGRSHRDELGMVHIDLVLEPHVATPIVNRAEADAQRLCRGAKQAGRPEPFERYLADAYAAMLARSGSGSRSGKGSGERPELVVVVSHEVAKRGWTEVREGEVCKIPGVGPVSPQVAEEIASDAFLTGVLYDGKDLRHMRRWTRNTPVEVLLALELGKPPDFDGVRCVDCGNRFRTENDHVEPHCARGPASTDNLEPRCWPCHQVKTERDRKAGKLTPPEP